MLTISGGSLTLNGSATEITTALLRNSGTVANNGVIQVGVASKQSALGIRNEGTGVFKNNAGGKLRLDYMPGSQGALLNASTFNNAGNIIFGTNGTVGNTALLNRGTFTNSGAGQIIINQFSEDGIYNLAPNSSFTNSASINIGSASAGANGIRNASNSTFINQATGVM